MHDYNPVRLVSILRNWTMYGIDRKDIGPLVKQFAIFARSVFCPDPLTSDF